MQKTLTVMLCALSLGVTALPAFDKGSDNDKHGAAQASDDQNRVRAHLNGPAISGEKPSGTAVSRSNDGQNSFRVEVDDVNLPDGTVLSVFLVQGGDGGHDGDQTRVGDLKIMMGSGELDLHARDGGQVPQAQPGDTVMVKQGRMNVLAGVFF